MSPPDRLSYLAFATGWRVVRLLPERLAYAVFRLLADLAWRRRGTGVARLESNLARVLPDVDARQLSRAGLRSYLRYWCDVFRMPDWSRDRIVGRVRCEHEERVREPMAAGNGVVAGLMHLGNWDHAGAWGSLTGLPVTTVVERLRPEPLFERFVAFRESLGLRILPLTGGGEVFRELTRDVRAGRIVPLLADRDLSSTGVTVLLVGHEARLPAGPAALALVTGAPLLPVSVTYEGREPHHCLLVEWHEAVPVPAEGTRAEKVAAMTQSLADAFTVALRRHPEDWHMLQRVFVADLDPARAGAGRAAARAAARAV